MTSPDISFTSSSDSGSDEDFQECPVYKNLRQSKAKLKQVGDPDFLVAECKKLDNKIELLQKNKRKLRKDKIGTLNWSRQLRELESYLEEGNEEELRTLESEHEEVQSTIKDLEEEINELQKQKESIGIQMDRKVALMNHWAHQFAAAQPVISACRDVFATVESISDAISEDRKASVEVTPIVEP